MTTQHTPGPWGPIVKSDNGDLAISYTSGEIRSYVATCHYMALCPEHGDLEANARLIAAAPELLAALSLMLDTFNAPGSPEGWDPLVCFVAVEKARATIAKAKGGHYEITRKS